MLNRIKLVYKGYWTHDFRFNECRYIYAKAKKKPCLSQEVSMVRCVFYVFVITLYCMYIFHSTQHFHLFIYIKNVVLGNMRKKRAQKKGVRTIIIILCSVLSVGCWKVKCINYSNTFLCSFIFDSTTNIGSKGWREL